MNTYFPKWLKGGLYGLAFAFITISVRFIPYPIQLAFPNFLEDLIKMNPAYWINPFLHTQGVWWQYFFDRLPYLGITLFIAIPSFGGSFIVDLYQKYKNKIRISFYRVLIYFITLFLILSPIIIPAIKFPLRLIAPEYSLSWNRFIHSPGCDFTIKYPASMKMIEVYRTPTVCSVKLQEDNNTITVQNVSNDPYAHVDTRFVTNPEKEEIIMVNKVSARKIIKSRNNIIIVLGDKSFNCFYSGLDDKAEDTFLDRCENIASTYHKL